MNQHFLDFIDGHPCRKSFGQSLLQCVLLPFGGAERDSDDGLLAVVKIFVRSGIGHKAFLYRFFIVLLLYLTQPDCGIVLRITFNGNMSEPTIRSSPMPMNDIGCNFHDVSRIEPACRFALFLIITNSCGGNQDLSAGMVMPVVPATRLESDIRHRCMQ